MLGLRIANAIGLRLIDLKWLKHFYGKGTDPFPFSIRQTDLDFVAAVLYETSSINRLMKRVGFNMIVVGEVAIFCNHRFTVARAVRARTWVAQWRRYGLFLPIVYLFKSEAMHSEVDQAETEDW